MTHLTYQIYNKTVVIFITVDVYFYQMKKKLYGL